jgi:hypothetical protein
MTRHSTNTTAAFALLSSFTLAQFAGLSVASTPVPDSEMTSVPPAPDAMDDRKPIPLLAMMASHQKQNMRDHLVAIQEIVSAIATDDFAAVEQSARRMGYSEQMGRMCTHMGAAAPGFAEQAMAFHHTADRITEAARARDRSRTLLELGATLQACTSCHAAWRQEVVDDPTWRRLTSPAAAGPAKSQ